MNRYEFVRDKELVNVTREGDWVCSLSYSHIYKDWALHSLSDCFELDADALACILNKVDELNREPATLESELNDEAIQFS